MLRTFNTQPKYLIQYTVVSSAAFLVFDVGMIVATYHRFTPSIWLWLLCLMPLLISSFTGVLLSCFLGFAFFAMFSAHELSGWQLLLVPMGIYWGMLTVPIIHNCAHRSFRPFWLNRVLGELVALQLLSGYPGFVVLHLTHHLHADDPVLDPHPNGNLSFYEYLRGLKGSLGRAYSRLYFEKWGETDESRRRWRVFRALLPIGRVLRGAVFLLVLGPAGFALFFAPAFIANQITFAHINYYTHAEQDDGSVEIVNLNHNWIYRTLNRMLFGIYFHKNHHQRPHLFNPTGQPSISKAELDRES